MTAEHFQYFNYTLSGQNQKLFVFVPESKTEFTWGLGIFVIEIFSGIWDELKIQNQNYPLQ
jgi:hypothetical protein